MWWHTDRILLWIDEQLHPELPSWKEDSLALFLRRVANFFILGIVTSGAVLLCVPNGKFFPIIWVESLLTLPNWFQILLYFFLTVTMVVFFSYSAGVFLVFILLHGFHAWLHRRSH